MHLRAAFVMTFFGLMTVSFPAEAVQLLPGQSASLSGSSNIPTGITPVGGTMTSNFGDSSLGFAGSITSQVVLDSTGHYDFLFQVTNTGYGTPATGDSIIRAAQLTFSGFTTAVDYYTGSVPVAGFSSLGTVAVSDASRSSAPGSEVSFDFAGPGIGVGQSSNIFFVSTNAVNFKSSGALSIQTSSGDNSTFALSFEPAGIPSPEPATSSMALSGLPLLAIRLWRRRRGQQA